MHRLHNIRGEITALELRLKKLRREQDYPIDDCGRKFALETRIQLCEAKLVELRRRGRLQYAYIQTENALRDYRAEVGES